MTDQIALKAGEHAGLLDEADCRYGRFHFLGNDDPIGVSLRDYGEWAQCEIDALLPFVGPGGVVVEAGAHIGTHTAAFADAVGADGRVVAFEPQQFLADLAAANTSAFGNVEIVPAAVGGSAGTTRLPIVDYSVHLNSGAVSVDANLDPAESIEVELHSVDGLSLDHCDLVLADVEGHEADVVRGMTATLSRCRPVVALECTDIDHGVELLRQDIWSDYAAYLLATPAFNPRNFRGATQNRFGFAMESLLLFVPTERLDSMAHMPAAVQAVRIDSLQDFAESLLSTPRYGDHRAESRSPALLERELDRVMTRNQSLEVASGILTRENSELRMRMKKRQTDIRRLRLQIKGLKAEVRKLRASMSWKLTRPVRACGRVMRRLTRSLKHSSRSDPNA